LQDPISKIPITERVGGVAQGEGPEFKPQYIYIKGQAPTSEQGKPEHLAPSHLLVAKLQKTGDKEELPASAFLFEMLSCCKFSWKGGEIIMSRKGKF
jgi:hypothetical protein